MYTLLSLHCSFSYLVKFYSLSFTWIKQQNRTLLPPSFINFFKIASFKIFCKELLFSAGPVIPANRSMRGQLWSRDLETGQSEGETRVGIGLADKRTRIMISPWFSLNPALRELTRILSEQGFLYCKASFIKCLDFTNYGFMVPCVLFFASIYSARILKQSH